MAANSRLLIAVDVDGTLLDTEFEDRLRPRELAALRAVREAGHVVALCTGRNQRSVASLLERSDWQPTELPRILLNGAVIYGGEPYRCLAENELDGATVRQLVEIFHDHDVVAMVYGSERDGGQLYHERRATNEILGHYLRLRGEQVGAIVAVDELSGHLPDRALEVGTIDARAKIEALTAAVRRQCADRVRVINTMSLMGGGRYYWAEVYHHRCGKGEGALQLAAAHGIAAQRIVAIGDNYNDLDMFAAARWSVAMANGPPEVRAQADRVAGDVAQSGAAQVLEEIAAGLYPHPDEMGNQP